MIRAYIGLGSNLADPRSQVTGALAEIAALTGVRLVCASSLWRTPPMGPADQPDYVNAVAAVDTDLPAVALLDELLAIERLHGRVRGGERWGPRTLDLDVLLYGDLCSSTVHLVIPHPGIAERAFVLHPLHEIAPDLAIPGLGTLAGLLVRCPATGMERIDDGA